jgi:hypothetical protein
MSCSGGCCYERQGRCYKRWRSLLPVVAEFATISSGVCFQQRRLLLPAAVEFVTDGGDCCTTGGGVCYWWQTLLLTTVEFATGGSSRCFLWRCCYKRVRRCYRRLEAMLLKADGVVTVILPKSDGVATDGRRRCS